MVNDMELKNVLCSTELMVNLQDYSVEETSMNLQVSLMVTPPAGGLAIPVTFMTSLQGITATEGH